MTKLICASCGWTFTGTRRSCPNCGTTEAKAISPASVSFQDAAKSVRLLWEKAPGTVMVYLLVALALPVLAGLYGEGRWAAAAELLALTPLIAGLFILAWVFGRPPGGR